MNLRNLKLLLKAKKLKGYLKERAEWTHEFRHVPTLKQRSLLTKNKKTKLFLIFRKK
jgi:hypothetical protein